MNAFGEFNSFIALLLFPTPLEQESLHQVHLTFTRNSLTHQALLFIQLSQGNAQQSRRWAGEARRAHGQPLRPEIGRLFATLLEKYCSKSQHKKRKYENFTLMEPLKRNSRGKLKPRMIVTAGYKQGHLKT
ncbi:hypothetical protein TNCV_2131081 [Trichonephila clavipes]|nr:hypothetical protein TNCV_2131081 [Trichonephila clavipes]